MPARARRDEALCAEIRRVWTENLQVYGARKVWWQLRREGFQVARCAVERPMRQLGPARRGSREEARTTVSHKGVPCPQDKVNRQFRAERPNALWGQRFLLRLDLAGLRLCGLRH